MWCWCRSRKPLNESVIELPTVNEEKEEVTQDIHEIPTVPSIILVRVFDTRSEINFKEPIPFYIRNILTTNIQYFIEGLTAEYKISALVSFGGEHEYGLLTCVKDSNLIPFPSELLNYLLSNNFNITVNHQGLKFDFIFDHIEKKQ